MNAHIHWPVFLFFLLYSSVDFLTEIKLLSSNFKMYGCRYDRGTHWGVVYKPEPFINMATFEVGFNGYCCVFLTPSNLTIEKYRGKVGRCFNEPNEPFRGR